MLSHSLLEIQSPFRQNEGDRCVLHRSGKMVWGPGTEGQKGPRVYPLGFVLKVWRGIQY